MTLRELKFELDKIPDQCLNAQVYIQTSATVDITVPYSNRPNETRTINMYPRKKACGIDFDWRGTDYDNANIVITG